MGDAASRFTVQDGQHQRLEHLAAHAFDRLGRHVGPHQAETLAELHQTYGVRYSGDRIPYVRAEGVDEILKKIPTKEAREARAGSFFDNSLLKELEQSGWFKSLER